ncbi:HDOD domain-containing protein [Zoogloea sp.]|uniref:HDOD domain-containing protein n=1 Tax=Zoogloea sp. TaxID=49181 RepID=UPI00262498EB|nr:HDOD domain-containing protein [Zoogloea sp.]MDD3355280.1 HDOD domain-containing protein [Zoogloea sp.]
MSKDMLVEAVLASGVVLPAPGPGFMQLQKAAADENAGPRELAAAVVDDPAITGALMRVANSPVFRPRSAPRSAFEAIAMLGQTRSLAIAASTTLKGQCAGLDMKAVENIWAASALAAEWSFTACRRLPCRSLADLVYLTALMQDAGIPVLLKRTSEHAHLFHGNSVALEAGARTLDALSGSDHAATSCLVARNWKLPPEVCDAIRHHHAPEMAMKLEDTARRLALLLAIGRRLRDGPSPDWTDWADLVKLEFGLGEDHIASLGEA